MKQSPEDRRLEEFLRSYKLVAGGFFGGDTRSVSEVIDADAATLSRLGFSAEQLAERMNQITKIATTGLGTWVRLDDRLEAKVDEAKGNITCPWPHPGQFAKRITHLRVIETGQTIFFSDLSTHLIADHAFFEGKGSPFRTDPAELVKMIF